jgi:hypothetical protein
LFILSAPYRKKPVETKHERNFEPDKEDFAKEEGRCRYVGVLPFCVFIKTTIVMKKRFHYQSVVELGFQ